MFSLSFILSAQFGEDTFLISDNPSPMNYCKYNSGVPTVWSFSWVLFWSHFPLISLSVAFPGLPPAWEGSCLLTRRPCSVGMWASMKAISQIQFYQFWDHGDSLFSEYCTYSSCICFSPYRLILYWKLIYQTPVLSHLNILDFSTKNSL